jgi:metallo-beta-lactamase class B
MRTLISCLTIVTLSIPFYAESRVAKKPQLPGAESNLPFKPFHIVGSIYYVGTNDLACYLITSPAGHILLDTGLEESGPIVKANIAALGFKLTDIKVILSSHAHFDHVAGHADMKVATGASVFASSADALVLESGGTKSFFPLTPYKPVKVDRIIKDGENVRLGGIQMTAHLTPGHTEGNTTWTTVAVEDGKKYDVVFAGSMSINSGVHLVNFKPWPGIADAYARSFQILKHIHCDVFLGPHARFFDMETKVRLMNDHSKNNPFVDPGGYQKFIAAFEQAYKEQLKNEQQSP